MAEEDVDIYGDYDFNLVIDLFFFFYFFLDITKAFDIKIGRRLRRDCSRCTNEKEIKV